MKVRTKVIELEAWQFSGVEQIPALKDVKALFDVPLWIIELTLKGNLIPHSDHLHLLHLDDGGDLIDDRIEPGDYILRYPNGDIISVCQTGFNTLFEMVEPEKGKII